MNSGSAGAVNVSPRLEKAITELRGLQELLLSGDGLDSRILTDFREALNRIRNTAWSAQQYIALKATEQDSANVLSILAGERVRAAYQLCQAIQIDLTSSEVKFQTGHLRTTVYAYLFPRCCALFPARRTSSDTISILRRSSMSPSLSACA